MNLCKSPFLIMCWLASSAAKCSYSKQSHENGSSLHGKEAGLDWPSGGPGELPVAWWLIWPAALFFFKVVIIIINI